MKRAIFEGLGYGMELQRFGKDVLIEIVHNGDRASQLVGGKYASLAERAYARREMRTYVHLFRKAKRIYHGTRS